MMGAHVLLKLVLMLARRAGWKIRTITVVGAFPTLRDNARPWTILQVQRLRGHNISPHLRKSLLKLRLKLVAAHDL
jgi:hypothetical protein